MLFAIPIQPSTLGMLLAVSAITSWLMFRASRRRPPSVLGVVPKPAGTSTAMPHEAERWQVALFDFARDYEARLDTKAALLQQLIRTADERIAKLESLGLEEPPQAASTKAKTSAGLSGPHFAASATGRNAAVYAMADAGNTAAAIANELGTPIGEIELILSLRRP